MITRRTLLHSSVAAGVAASAALLARARFAGSNVVDHAHHAHGALNRANLTVGRPVAGESYTPVIMPNGRTLPFEKKGGVKVFHVIAEPVTHEIAPGLEIEAWGYNGGTPGPLIECVEGDRVRFYVTNKLPEPTTLHWHGIVLPAGMDGVAGLTQKPIPAGKTFKYEFTMQRPGTFMYHPHFNELTQIALGMVGMIVVHPRRPRGGRALRDYALMAHEWMIPIGARRPNPMAMNDFNVLTFNHKAFPATEPLVAETGDLVRIRIGNLGPMDNHPIHLHGFSFQVVETDGGPVPPRARWPETTVLVPVGAARVIELVADAPGDWALHCHMTHHVMNQMEHGGENAHSAHAASGADSPRNVAPGHVHGRHPMKGHHNSISMLGGKGPFGAIDMGGMFTVLKVRDSLPAGKDPGWYAHPAGTVATEATTDELRRDGIAR